VTFQLDCESGEAAISSLSVGFSCTQEKLREVLLSIDLDEVYEHKEQCLYNYVVREVGEHKELSGVYWFHSTRTSLDNNFQYGIHPLNDALDKVWDVMISTIPTPEVKQNLQLMRTIGVNDEMYELRTNDSIHWGPYGILVREVAFNTKKLKQHDYLKMPELVEDICNAYKLTYEVSLDLLYENLLIPKLVKFYSSKRLDNGCIEAALNYAYTKIRKLPINESCVTVLNNGGTAIKPEEIVNVETVSP